MNKNQKIDDLILKVGEQLRSLSFEKDTWSGIFVRLLSFNLITATLIYVLTVCLISFVVLDGSIYWDPQLWSAGARLFIAVVWIFFLILSVVFICIGDI